MSYRHAANLSREDRRQVRQVVAERSAKRASDFEERLPDNRVRIYRGHPCYCPSAQGGVQHNPHVYKYVYLTDDGPACGEYECDGTSVNVRDR